ncbi:hypothetical protein [Pedobacter montanisoli]|uniref:Aerotolerance regulator N-terminal domain-containing protein n=1 Tax=Pedobacter montanisoli TaxID=2923277 RepID=A0ABS9ZZA9_9SPHI|nr:hypothetical protein [Pedobacter montanisoli]MCJ0743642.1 hypothetical protein [Pedobacter montanisoli]
MGFGTFVIGICMVLLAFLIYKEIKRTHRHWLTGRIVVSIVMIACFAFLILPLSFETSLQNKKGQLNLITDGVSADSLAKIKGIKYYTDPLLADQLKQKADFIPDLAYYLIEHKDVQNIEVYGYGLAADELKKLKNYKITFHPSAMPYGIISCNWTEKLHEEETFTVQGSFHNTLNKAIQLKLTGFGTALDSVMLPAQKLSNFNLNHQIRQKGKALLELIALNGKDTLTKEIIPVQTITRVPLRVFMLTSFPSFEYNFLKKWLYENQYPLMVRSRISKDKYSVDFLNRNSSTINSIQAGLLEKEDVLIIDQQELENISPAEKRAIEQAVTKGMGLIIWADQPGANTALINSFKLTTLQVQDKLTNLFVLDREMALASLPSNQQLYISPSSRQQAVIASKEQHLVAAEELYGNGKIVATTLQNSYQWMLSGQQRDYARYWSELINAAARKQEPGITLQTHDYRPVVQHRLLFQIETADTNVPLIQYGEKHLAVKQNLLFPNSWEAQTWPLNSGWQTLSVNQRDFNFFVYGKANWKALRQYELLEQNLNFVRQHQVEVANTQETTTVYRHEVSKWWFFICFVFAIGFLWLEDRVFNRG